MRGRATCSLVLTIAACGGQIGPGEGGGTIDAAVVDSAVDRGDGGDPPRALPAFCAAYPPADLAGAGQSAYVAFGDDGFLHYAADDRGNRIPDFGGAGYHAGEDEPPDVPEVLRIGPGEGDDTARIQAALDEVAAREPDDAGVRGALVLEPGVYDIAGTVHVEAGGVVLRGSGDGDDATVDTILRAPGDSPHQRTVIVLGSGGGVSWQDALDGTRTEITTPFVTVGERSFEVDAPERLAVGDRVIVRHPSTQAWIDALGGGGATTAWTAGSMDVPYLRRVVAIDGARITLDAPVHQHLDRALAHSVVYAVDDGDLIREAGVEDLRVDIVTAGGVDENHAWNAIAVDGAEDAWVRRITALHFGYAGVVVGDSDHITVRDSRALDPIGEVTGGRMYNFAANPFAQQVLFADCEASRGRHSFVANGAQTTSGIVFLRGRTTDARGTSEGHRRWSQALLYDSIVESNPGSRLTVGLYNRGDWGTQHGWGAVHSVLWHHDTADQLAIVQRPPTAQNWAIGTHGGVTADGPFEGPAGLAEPITGTLAPASLYEAQVCDRLRR